MPVSHRAVRERPDAVLVARTHTELADAVSQRGARAVGKYASHAQGYSVPVVYVSKRATPWVVRHRKGLIISGVPLVVMSTLALLFLWVGPAWFIGGLVAAAFLVATLVRYSRGGGGGRGSNVSVSVNVRTR
jgi:hypothetical protein